MKNLLPTIAIFSLAVGGCATRSPQVSDNRDPNEVLSSLSQRMTRAQSDNEQLLSPQYYSKAQEYYLKADKARNDSSPSTPEILENARLSEAYLDKADRNASISRLAMPNALEARKSAETAGATTYFPAAFSNLDEKMLAASRSVENGNLSDAKGDQANLARQYDDLGKRSVFQHYIGDTKKTIQTARDEGAEKWSPQLLKEAQAKYDSVTKQVLENPNDTSSLEQMSAEAKAKADAVLSNTRESKYLASLPPEERGRKMAELKAQQASIENEKNAQLNQSQQQVAALQDEVAAGATLKEKGAKSEKIKEISSQFAPEEAEVYQQGDKLLIRLKGLEFKKSGADIPSENFQLLNKVGKAIAQFGPEAKVTIAGNTDSTGAHTKNVALSEKRADAVKDYLVSSNVITERQVSTEGLASSKPIATNKTSEGRKQNRRVDITVEEASS